MNVGEEVGRNSRKIFGSGSWKPGGKCSDRDVTVKMTAAETPPTLSGKDRASCLTALFAKAEGLRKEPVSDVTENRFTLLSENGKAG